jgi:hypothetical protein
VGRGRGRCRLQFQESPLKTPDLSCTGLVFLLHKCRNHIKLSGFFDSYRLKFDDLPYIFRKLWYELSRLAPPEKPVCMRKALPFLVSFGFFLLVLLPLAYLRPGGQKPADLAIQNALAWARARPGKLTATRKLAD